MNLPYPINRRENSGFVGGDAERPAERNQSLLWPPLLPTEVPASTDGPFQDAVAPQIPISSEQEASGGIVDKIRSKWLGANIKTYMVLKSLGEEFSEGIRDTNSRKKKAEIVSTTGIALAGQAYERARLPETLAANIGSNTYKEVMERGYLSIFATLAGSIAVGMLVYGQQKIIGRNMLRTTKHFPHTYDTAKQLWPKTMDFVDDSIPSIDKPVRQGLAMVGLGTTPFVMTARANNPNIDKKELLDIERKVTRRGSVASGALGFLVLGSLSLAPHIPDSIFGLDIPDDVPRQMVDKSQLVVDTLSSPLKMISLLTAGAVLGKAYSGIKKSLRK